MKVPLLAAKSKSNKFHREGREEREEKGKERH